MYSIHYFTGRHYLTRGHDLTGRRTHYRTQYNVNIGIISEPFDRVKLNVFVDYRIKYLDPEMEGDNDLFFRAKLEYDIKLWDRRNIFCGRTMR